MIILLMSNEMERKISAVIDFENISGNLSALIEEMLENS
jgi:hypothetical protein